MQRDVLVEVLEEPTPGDGVVGALELEQERLPVRQHPEAPTPGLGIPEVDLVHIRLGGQEVEPVRVGSGDVGVQGRAPGGGFDEERRQRRVPEGAQPFLPIPLRRSVDSLGRST